ncbi:MAG: hypothetical protein RR911_07240 [Oscillospiraceae bacterium]
MKKKYSLDVCKEKFSLWKFIKSQKGLSILLLIVLGLTLIYFVFIKVKLIDYSDTSANTGQIEQIQQKPTREDLFSVSINTKLYLTKDNKVAAYIKNDKTNKYNMQVLIKEDSTDKVLYQSDILKPGRQIDYINLNERLKKGSYKATAEFLAMDIKSGEASGKVVVELVIISEE